jgi:hypothetical protein
MFTAAAVQVNAVPSSVMKARRFTRSPRQRARAERAAYLARFQTASTITPCPIDATGLVYRSSSPASVNDRF